MKRKAKLYSAQTMNVAIFTLGLIALAGILSAVAIVGIVNNRPVSSKVTRDGIEMHVPASETK